MLGSKNAVGGGVWETDDKSSAFLPGEAAGSVSVHGVQRRDGDCVADGTHKDTAWERSGWEMALGSHGPWWGATNLQDDLPDHRGTAEMPH